MSRRIVACETANKWALAVWIAILVLTGTYLRTRDADTIPKTDWLVTLQVVAGAFAIAIGTALIKKHRCGLGGKAVVAFLIAAACSAVFSPYWDVVLGYWIVTAGAYLLTVGLVRQSRSQEALDRIERVWFLTLLAVLLKDTVIELAFPDPDAPDGELFRLGMGLTHANLMSVLAAISFWISFRDHDTRSRFLLWPARLLFIVIVVLSRTRIAMIGLVIGGVIRAAIRHSRGERARGYPLLVAIPCGLVVVILLWALAASWEIETVANVTAAFNRGADTATVMSITGRTEIWTYALEKISDSPLPQLLFGHGFGTSRFVLNDDGYRAIEYYVAHAHNTFLEIVLSMGFLGAIPFVVTVLYGLRWITDFASLRETFSLAFALRAVSALSVILVASMTEAVLGGKVGPVAMIYVFYITALDQRDRIASSAIPLLGAGDCRR